MRLEGDKEATIAPKKHSGKEVFMAWLPYLLLVIFVLVWGEVDIKMQIDRFTNGLLSALLPVNPNVLNGLNVPGLHNMIVRIPPVTAAPAPYGAITRSTGSSAAGTACFLASVATAILLRGRRRNSRRTSSATFKQLKMSMVTIAYDARSRVPDELLRHDVDARSRAGGDRRPFPFFSAVLGWLGVFLTGSDTSANALFGNLQVVTANALGLNPVLTASVNSAAGVMGKMISLQSIAVAVAATGMTTADESRLFRFTIKHSMLLMIMMGIISMMYAYVFPQWVPVVPPK